MAIFSIDEHMHYKGQYKMHIAMEAYDEMCSAGPVNASFNTLAARLLRMDYPSFLKMLRQDYGAELHGKTGKYVYYSFTDKSKANELIKVLNKRWNILMALKPI